MAPNGALHPEPNTPSTASKPTGFYHEDAKKKRKGGTGYTRTVRTTEKDEIINEVGTPGKPRKGTPLRDIEYVTHRKDRNQQMIYQQINHLQIDHLQIDNLDQ